MWLSHVATLVKGDDDITSNSVAKFSMPLQVSLYISAMTDIKVKVFICIPYVWCQAI